MLGHCQEGAVRLGIHTNNEWSCSGQAKSVYLKLQNAFKQQQKKFELIAKWYQVAYYLSLSKFLLYIESRFRLISVGNVPWKLHTRCSPSSGRMFALVSSPSLAAGRSHLVPLPAWRVFYLPHVVHCVCVSLSAPCHLSSSLSVCAVCYALAQPWPLPWVLSLAHAQIRALFC